MISLKQILNEVNAESRSLYINKINRFLPAFLDRKTNKVYLTGVFHHYEILPDEIRNLAIKSYNNKKFSNKRNRIIDGFYDQQDNKFLDRSQLYEILYNKKDLGYNEGRINKSEKRLNKQLDMPIEKSRNKLEVIQL